MSIVDALPNNDRVLKDSQSTDIITLRTQSFVIHRSTAEGRGRQNHFMMIVPHRYPLWHNVICMFFTMQHSVVQCNTEKQKIMTKLYKQQSYAALLKVQQLLLVLVR